MMNRFYLVCLLLLASLFVCGQQPINPDKRELVYPIRQGHKTGFILIKEYGSIPIIDPIYDYIADTYLPWNTTLPILIDSPYRLFQIDEKVGLLDTLLQVVIPHKYNRIRPVCEDYFAVEIDSLFALIDKEEKLINPGPYQNICLADPFGTKEVKYLFVQKDGRWGISTLTGDLVLDYQFIDIQSAGKSGFYKVKTTNEDYWSLIDNEGKQLLPGSYEDILVLDNKLIAVKEVYWSLYTKKSNDPNARMSLQEREAFSQLGKLNDELFWVLRPNSSKQAVAELWNIKNQKKFREYKTTEISEGKYLPSFKPLDDRYFIRVDLNGINKSQKYEYLTDNEGKTMSNGYTNIQSTQKEYVYQCGFDQGLSVRNGEPWLWTLVTPLYPKNNGFFGDKGKIYPFNEDFALTTFGGKYGLIYLSDDGKADKLEEVYSYVNIIDDNNIHVQLGEKNVRYTLVNGKLEAKLIVETTAIPKNRIPKVMEAGVAKIPVLEEEDPQFFTSQYIKYSLEAHPKGQAVIRNFMEKVGRFAEEEKAETFFVLANKTDYHGAKELSSKLVALFEPTIVETATPFGQRVLDAKPKRIQVASSILEDVIPLPNLIGIRKFDVEDQAATFIDANGQMGLVDNNAQEIRKNGQALRFTYIGPFYDGIAVACTGGKLILDRSGTGKDGPALKKLSEFKEEFHIKTINKNGGGGSAHLDKKIHVLGSELDPVQWMYINTRGATLFQVDAYYAHNYNPIDKTAQFDQRFEKTHSNGFVSKVKRTGLVDKNGRTVLEPVYNWIKKHEEFYLVSKQGTPTFSFNDKGHQIRKNATRLRPFSEKYAVFKNEAGDWGYMNDEGEEVIPPQFKKARPFSENRALVMNQSGVYVFIDKTGEEAFSTGLSGEQLWQMIGDFKEGRCWFKEQGRSFKWGAYDRSGKVVIEPTFHFKPKGRANIEKVQNMPMDFSKGVAAVRLKLGTEYRAAIIDTVGNFIIEPTEIHAINGFDEGGYATFQKKMDGLYGLIQSDGTITVKPRYKKIEGFVNGYARVLSEQKKWGLIDITGTQVVPTDYIEMDTLSEGLVGVKLDYKGWYFIDTQNRKRIKGSFSQVQEFKNGITLVEKDKQKLIINKKGDIIQLKLGHPIFFSSGILGVEVGQGKDAYYYYADAQGTNLFGRYFTAITPFNLKSAKVKTNSPVYKSKRFSGAINKRGVMVVPAKFNTLHFQPDGNIIINPQIYQGIMSKSGQEILEVAYDQILPMQPYIAPNNRLNTNNPLSGTIILRVEDGEKIGYFQFKNGQIEEIWGLQN